jgi:hypothetical protein
MTISGTTPSIHGIHGMHGMAIPGKKQRLPGMTISGTTPSIQGIHGMRGMTIPGKKHRQKQRCALEQNAPIEWIAHTKKTHATLSKFLAKRCMTDIFATGIFHETDVIKELSECVGMLRAVQRLGETLERVNFSDDASVQCIVSGDGASPRLGTFLAFFTQWNISSVDPGFRSPPTLTAVQRLQTFSKPILETDFTASIRDRVVVLINCHSHGVLSEDWVTNHARAAKELYIIDMPCCMLVLHDSILKNPHARHIQTFQDEQILSPHNWIQIYSFECSSGFHQNFGVNESTL